MSSSEQRRLKKEQEAEQRRLKRQLEQAYEKEISPAAKDALTDILENQPMQFNDELVRQMLQCVVVENKDQIKVIFNDGTEIDQPIQNC